MPAHDRPKRQSVKALSKTQKAEADETRNKDAEKARRAAASAAATKKRTVEDVSDRFFKMRIAGGRRRLTRRKARLTKSRRK